MLTLCSLHVPCLLTVLTACLRKVTPSNAVPPLLASGGTITGRERWHRASGRTTRITSRSSRRSGSQYDAHFEDQAYNLQATRYICNTYHEAITNIVHAHTHVSRMQADISMLLDEHFEAMREKFNGTSCGAPLTLTLTPSPTLTPNLTQASCGATPTALTDGSRRTCITSMPRARRPRRYLPITYYCCCYYTYTHRLLACTRDVCSLTAAPRWPRAQWVGFGRRSR